MATQKLKTDFAICLLDTRGLSHTSRQFLGTITKKCLMKPRWSFKTFIWISSTWFSSSSSGSLHPPFIHICLVAFQDLTFSSPLGCCPPSPLRNWDLWQSFPPFFSSLSQLGFCRMICQMIPYVENYISFPYHNQICPITHVYHLKI